MLVSLLPSKARKKLSAVFETVPISLNSVIIDQSKVDKNCQLMRPVNEKQRSTDGADEDTLLDVCDGGFRQHTLFNMMRWVWQRTAMILATLLRTTIGALPLSFHRSRSY